MGIILLGFVFLAVYSVLSIFALFAGMAAKREGEMGKRIWISIGSVLIFLVGFPHLSVLMPLFAYLVGYGLPIRLTEGQRRALWPIAILIALLVSFMFSYAFQSIFYSI